MRYLILLGILAGSCIEIIDADIAENVSGTLVIEGGITSENKRHKVQLTKSHSPVGNAGPQAVTGAQLTIYSHTDTYILTEVIPGTYLTDSIQGEVGQQYTLEILYQNQRYEATDSMVAASPELQVELTKLNTIPGVDNTQYFEFFYRSNFGNNKPYIYHITSEIADNVYNYYPQNWQPADWLQMRLNENRLTTVDSTYYLLSGLEPPAILAYGRTNESRNLYGSVITERFYSMSPKHYDFVRSMLSETDWKTLGRLVMYRLTYLEMYLMVPMAFFMPVMCMRLGRRYYPNYRSLH